MGKKISFKRRVFGPNWKDVPVTMDQSDFERLSFIINELCEISDLYELHECKRLLTHVSIQNYKEDLRIGIQEMYEIFG